MSAPERPSPRGVLWALMFGNFVLGAGVMIAPGTLNEIAASLVLSAWATRSAATAAPAIHST